MSPDPRMPLHRALFALGLAATLLLATTGAAAAASRFAGHWEGTIQVPGNALAFNIDLAGGDDATLAGDISIPVQNLVDMKLSGLRVAGDSIGFFLDGIPGHPTFRGAANAALDTVVGDFEQGGQQFRFNMGRAAAPAEAARDALAGFDDVVNQALKDFRVPGLALVVVRDGQVVLSKGYGYRDVAQQLPVTPHTLFEIGSSTKAFTVMLLGQLVDEGRLDWDKPVRTWLPDFALYDPVATAQMTPRDLVTHRSGLPRHDLVWYNSPADRAELFQRLRYLEPNKGFREEFQYNNLMFMTAGYLAERVTGTGWEEQVRTRIFQPLGMTHSIFRVADLARDPDACLGYEIKDDHVSVIPYRDIVNVAPAGAIKSCADDMARWLLAQLGEPVAGGQPLVQAATLREMHTSQMVITTAQTKPELPVSNYGLGWFIQPYQGHLQVHHGGNIDGFSALVTLFPNDRLGIVALTNMNATPLGSLLTRTAVDRLLGLPKKDWLGETLAKVKAGEAADKEAGAKKDLVRVKGTKPSHPLADYAGEYENPGYGILKVEQAGAALRMTFNGIVQPLEHWHYDVFNGAKGAADPVFEDQKLLFTMNADGDIDGLSTVLEPEVKAIVFTRKPDARMSDEAYLRTLAGRYDLGPTPLTINLNGHQLKVTVPGQPPLELVPTRLNQFEVKGLSGFGARFAPDAKSGRMKLTWIQPNGVYEAVQNPPEKAEAP